jgi:hypothetical protein
MKPKLAVPKPRTSALKYKKVTEEVDENHDPEKKGGRQTGAKNGASLPASELYVGLHSRIGAPKGRK